MGKGQNRRRRKRRLRGGRHERMRAAPDSTVADLTLSVDSRLRVLSGFRSLRGQGGVRLSLTTFGSPCPARDPAELRAYASSATIPAGGGDSKVS